MLTLCRQPSTIAAVSKRDLCFSVQIVENRLNGLYGTLGAGNLRNLLRGQRTLSAHHGDNQVAAALLQLNERYSVIFEQRGHF